MRRVRIEDGLGGVENGQIRMGGLGLGREGWMRRGRVED